MIAWTDSNWRDHEQIIADVIVAFCFACRRAIVRTGTQLTTGTVHANSYKETPVVSLVGGIVRNVSGELGQNVRRGQAVAVVFSNELADAQARYLTAVAALDEHHRHHMRTEKLVEIGAASRQDLETATSQYREAESNLANLRQKLMLLGLSSQRMSHDFRKLFRLELEVLAAQQSASH
ncbi:MAG TPA: efflux RND transporter periplasmic adaptor subunit [Pyrinomonadaceae bacterium]